MKTFNEYLTEKDNNILDKGEYYADFDDNRGKWCVYHTFDTGNKKETKKFGCFYSKEDAEKEAKKLQAKQK